MITINIYSIETNEEKIKFKVSGTDKMRTAKIRFSQKGFPFFEAVGRQRHYFSEFIRNDSPLGDKFAYEQGIIAQKYI